MSKNQEAIELLEKTRILALEEGSDAIVLILNTIKRILESEPEPGEFTKEVRTVLGEPQSIPARLKTITDYTLEACDRIDSLTAEKELCSERMSFEVERAAKLDVKVEDLTTELKTRDERIKELEPKPLLFGNLDSFKVIISESVPENQIWFASKEQLNEALEYSMRFIEKELEHLEAENKELKNTVGDLRAKAVRKGLMNRGSFTGKA